jgi:hypothetical protein
MVQVLCQVRFATKYAIRALLLRSKVPKNGPDHSLGDIFVGA